MKKKLFICLILALSACAHKEDVFEPEYNRLAAHINVIGQTSKYVVYEYSDIRVDEVATVAAVYCNDHCGKVAELYDISLTPEHRRRATFICR